MKIGGPNTKKNPKNLWQLARCILSLPHGNLDPERGFSINKSVLQIHGTSLEEDTTVALQLVKDYIVLNNGVDKIDIEESLTH